eukprot:397214-Prorocentrum_minimum.AAC.1
MPTGWRNTTTAPCAMTRVRCQQDGGIQPPLRVAGARKDFYGTDNLTAASNLRFCNSDSGPWRPRGVARSG